MLLWVAASFAFRGYLHFFNTYNKTYGSLGAAMILLMWLYITGFSFLIGGEINAQIEHAAAVRGYPEAKAPGEKKAAELAASAISPSYRQHSQNVTGHGFDRIY